MRTRLTVKLVGLTGAVLALVVTLVSATWAGITWLDPEWTYENRLSDTTDDVLEGLQLDAQGRPVAVKLAAGLQHAMDALPTDLFYAILDGRGTVLLASNTASPSLDVDAAQVATAPTTFERTRNGQEIRARITPVPHVADRYVLVARSDRFDATLRKKNVSTARKAAVVSSALALSIFGVVVVFTLNRMLGRLRAISDAAARIDPNNLSARLEVDRLPAEIAPLIESFNAVLARLEEAFRLQKHFIAATAHELQTPLTLMRGQIEVSDPIDREVLLKDVDHMSRQVHQLLHLAEVCDPKNFTLAAVDPAPVLADVAEHLDRLARAHDVRIEVTREGEPATVRADRGALFVLARNLVENAIHHAPAGSAVAVRVGRDGFSVTDRGPGIPAADRPHLFERFWRGSHRRDEGAGLGLAICSEIVRNHRWWIDVVDRPVGTEFAVRFVGPPSPSL